MPERTTIESYSEGPLRYVANKSGSVVVIRSKFRPFDGEMEFSNHLKISLNIGRTGSYFQQSDTVVLDERWKRNGIVVNLPRVRAYGRSSAMSMIGVALDLEALPQDLGLSVSVDALKYLSSKITMDAVAAGYIRDLFDSADHHGCSTAFFSEKLGQLFRRLKILPAQSQDVQVAALDEARLAKVLATIDAHIGGDVSVQMLAEQVAMDQTNFAKAFRGAIGMPPYAFLTHQRMKVAKIMLREGESVTATALALNYSNPSKFSAAFKRHVGSAPASWAKAQRE